MNPSDVCLSILAALVQDQELAAWAEDALDGSLTVQLGDDEGADEDLPTPCLLLTGWTSERQARGGTNEIEIEIEAWVQDRSRQIEQDGRLVVWTGFVTSGELLARALDVIRRMRGLGNVRTLEQAASSSLCPLFAAAARVAVSQKTSNLKEM